MMKNNLACPKCGDPINAPDVLQCVTCNFEPHSRKELWKPANMGKQRIKPVANRTGKKQIGQPKLHHR